MTSMWHQWKSLSIRILISTVRRSSQFYKVIKNHMLIPELTGCIQVDSELHVKFFIETCFVPYPRWLHQSQDFRLSRKSMLGNFPVCLESYIENISFSSDQLQKHTFTKTSVYSVEIGKYGLLLQYTSIHSYRMLLEHFPLPSLSLLHKIILLQQWHDRCCQMCTEVWTRRCNVGVLHHACYLEFQL